MARNRQSVNIRSIGEIQLPTFKEFSNRNNSTNVTLTTREDFQLSCRGTPQEPSIDDAAYYSHADWCYTYDYIQYYCGVVGFII